MSDKRFVDRAESASTEDPQHGVRFAFYSNLPGPRQTAILECLCGEELAGQTSSWEDAGHEMDLHLERVKRGQQRGEG